MLELKKSLDQWKKYGQHLLLATEYKDPILKTANGCVIRDVDGNEFIDLESGQICSILGHSHPKLTQNIILQIEKLMHVGTAFVTQPVLEAAQKIANIAPGKLKKSLILSTGAEANECALRIAKIHTQKSGIVGFHKGYAGLTLATMNIGGNSQNTSLCVPGAFKILTPDCLYCSVQASFPQCDFLCLKVSEEILLKHCQDSVAAFIVEPVLSAGGMIFPPPGYFSRLKEVATRFNALLISDEAQTGMARTGKWFGMDHDGVEPDILVLSKGVGGGFPASAVVVNEDIAENIQRGFTNFSSHQSDPVAAAAISTVIEIIEDENLVMQASEAGSYFIENLLQLNREYPILKNIRGKGLMIGMDAGEIPGKNLEPCKVGLLFEAISRRMGVHLKSILDGKVFRILPPLTISKKEIDKVLSVFEDAMRQLMIGDYDLNWIFPKNTYVHKYQKIRENKLSLKRILQKGWETPPDQMVTKIKKKLIAR